MDFIQVIGAKTNNLAGINLNLPLGKFVAVTGVSGSGKSSLVFDTLYAESYRRYVESLSSYARQYLKALPKPVCDDIKNLPPAVAVRQSRQSSNNRSTVGTLTELSDFIQIIFAHLGIVHCRSCLKPVIPSNEISVAKCLVQKKSEGPFTITIPLKEWQLPKNADIKGFLLEQGFSKIADEEGKISLIEAESSLDISKVLLVVDRVSGDEDNWDRLCAACSIGLQLGQGNLVVFDQNNQKELFSSIWRCLTCQIDYLKPIPALFSFNHPYGACENCQGYGLAMQINWNKVTPDLDSTIGEFGVVALNFGQHRDYYNELKLSAKKNGIDINKPFKDFSASDWCWFKDGDGAKFEGMNGYFSWLDSKKYKAHYRIHAAKFRQYITCPTCGGSRLRHEAQAVKTAGKSIQEINNFSLSELREWLESLDQLLSDDMKGIEDAIYDCKRRLRYLNKVGLNYLTLSRSATTLSGGEHQRIQMARCLGSALTHSLFCLDEPTCGLHPRDSSRLVEVLCELRDQGNTVVVVEHEKAVLEKADYLVQVGPLAGHLGGNITFEGKALKYISQLKKWSLRSSDSSYRLNSSDFIELRNVYTNNLKGISVKIPLGALTAVCGVSGSGKTSLVQHTLYPLLAKSCGLVVDTSPAELNGAILESVDNLKKIKKVEIVSQQMLGRSSRSTIATYLGIFESIRRIFSEQPLARKNKFKPTFFSFNSPHGRCETCLGLGMVVEDLSFLGDVEITCPSCRGKRFKPEILQITFRGVNLNDVLNMTVAQVHQLFFDYKKITSTCEQVIGLGLGYLTLGQRTSSFSGGEATRLKLLALLKEQEENEPSFLIFDEPTSGLSDYDVELLLEQLRKLIQKGHTILVVEHHTGVLKQADWLVELGPDAGPYGGRLIFQGLPSDIGQAKDSHTAHFILN